MRIAICDDNIADRRHAERLLKRESDRVHSLGEESYVIDCYGNTGKLYPMADTYDIFLIDMVDDPDPLDTTPSPYDFTGFDAMPTIYRDIPDIPGE